MGRPIKKRFFGKGPDALNPVMYFRKDAAEAEYFSAYIKKQKGTRRYVISSSDDSWSEVMTLVSKPFENLEPGEFAISFHIEDSFDNVFPNKIQGRTIRGLTNDQDAGFTKYEWALQSVRLPMHYWEVTIPDPDSFATYLLYPSGVDIGSTISLEGVLPELNGNIYTVTELVDVSEFPNSDLATILVSTGVIFPDYEFGFAGGEPAGYITIITPRPVAKL